MPTAAIFAPPISLTVIVTYRRYQPGSRFSAFLHATDEIGPAAPSNRRRRTQREGNIGTMKLTITTQVSVDGVMQGNGGRHPDLDPGFERGGWARPLFDSEAMTFVDQTYQRADAFLFGRRTYELFAGYWGVREDLDNPIVGALNTKPKYLTSTTLTEPTWANTTVPSGDLAVAIGELKAEPGGELQVHGSGTLTRWLLANDLVDEMNLLIVPVVVGRARGCFRRRPGHRVRPGRLANLPEGHHEPGLAARRAPQYATD